jgi:ssDNA-binding Zn-finger/Zn-ribbon topoisomerase 1
MKSPKKKAVPTNADVIATMQRKDPDLKFGICEICGDYAVVWPGDPYYGMHPMGCFDSPKGQRLMYELRKQEENNSSNQSLF